MSNTVIIVLVISFPLILGLILFFVFRRLKNKDTAVSAEATKEQEDLDRLLLQAEFKEAQVVSVRPEDQSRYNPSERIVKFRFAIKTGEKEFVTLRARWKIDNIYMSNFQQGNKIQVKVYNNFVFPTYPGAKLIPDSVRS